MSSQTPSLVSMRPPAGRHREGTPRWRKAARSSPGSKTATSNDSPWAWRRASARLRPGIPPPATITLRGARPSIDPPMLFTSSPSAPAAIRRACTGTASHPRQRFLPEAIRFAGANARRRGLVHWRGSIRGRDVRCVAFTRAPCIPCPAWRCQCPIIRVVRHPRCHCPAKARMTGSVDELLACLDLEPLADDLFRGQSIQTGWFRVFGGRCSGRPWWPRRVPWRPAARLIPSTPISSSAAIPPPRSITRWSGSAMGAASPRGAGRGPPAWPCDLHPLGLVPHRGGRCFPSGRHAGRAAPRGAARRPRSRRGGGAGDPRDHAGLSRTGHPDRVEAGGGRTLSVARSARASVPRLDAGARAATGRAGATQGRTRLCFRPDAPRCYPDSPRQDGVRRVDSIRQPGSRALVPPIVPRR